MAVANLTGFETGSSVELNAVSGTQSIQSTTKRGGNYAGRCNPTTSSLGYYDLGGVNAAGGEANGAWADVWISVYFQWATKPAASDEPVLAARTSGGVTKLEIRLDS